MASILQADVIDIAGWPLDELYFTYPEGAREKNAVFPPDTIELAFIKKKRRYLFKRSDKKYPDQFWGEIVAYLVGELLGVSVPPAFAAINSSVGDCGALIEWFYEDGKAVYVAGGQFMQRHMPDFDRKRGEQHNFHSIQVILKSLVHAGALAPTWERWWAEAFLFDALIGNTDRHQDNWGCMFRRRPDQTLYGSMAPLFDNGTSLGHERFPEHLKSWTDENFQRYVGKGTHHVKWQKDDASRCGHTDILRMIKQVLPNEIDTLRQRIDSFDIDRLVEQLDHLRTLPLKVSLTEDRKQLYIELIRLRKSRIQDALR